MKRLLLALVIIIVFVVALYIDWYVPHERATQAPAPTPIATVHYVCDKGKTIDASFYRGESKPPAGPDQPPTPGGSAKVSLSDGRSLTLAQTISADGARYSNGDPSKQGSETFVFWSKGNGAMVLENNSEQTYTGCILVVADPGGLPQVYESGSNGFSIRYPAGYTLDDTYKYQEFGPGKDIAGVKFTIPGSVATGTNLASDSYLSVESIPKVQDCNAKLFLDGITSADVHEVTDNGTTYSVASTTGAGAGNRYEETVYALPGTNPCIAIRYFIHYGVIENYPPGMVKQFDHAALIDEFDAIRRTITLQ